MQTSFRPHIVYVLPEPVWPQAITAEEYPSNTEFKSFCTSHLSMTWSCRTSWLRQPSNYKLKRDSGRLSWNINTTFKYVNYIPETFLSMHCIHTHNLQPECIRKNYKVNKQVDHIMYIFHEYTLSNLSYFCLFTCENIGYYFCAITCITFQYQIMRPWHYFQSVHWVSFSYGFKHQRVHHIKGCPQTSCGML